MSLTTLLDEDRRLVILRGLAEDQGYELNESVLLSVLALYGHTISRDQVHTYLAWLKEQGLITLREAGGYQIATLTARGADAARGAATIPGVKRPSPKG